jgi:hypothetical protein
MSSRERFPKPLHLLTLWPRLLARLRQRPQARTAGPPLRQAVFVKQACDGSLARIFAIQPGIGGEGDGGYVVTSTEQGASGPVVREVFRCTTVEEGEDHLVAIRREHLRNGWEPGAGE